jgi:hypothetical protein
MALAENAPPSIPDIFETDSQFSIVNHQFTSTDPENPPLPFHNLLWETNQIDASDLRKENQNKTKRMIHK